MNAAILKKILAELQSDKPRLDYCIGMLETLIDIDGGSSSGRTADFGPAKVGSTPTPPAKQKDEGDVLDATARARIGHVMESVKDSVHVD